MWLVTPIGFFSIVQKPSDHAHDTLTVRARVRSDLVALKQQYLPGLGPIQESLDTDYRFRAVAPRAEVSAAMTRLVEELDYVNFKSEVAKRQGYHRAGLYHRVWDVLYTLQTDPAFADPERPAEVTDDEKQVIVEIGREGGSITLCGIRSTEGWRFRVERNQSALLAMLDEDDVIKLPEYPWVKAWRSALKQLDTYPWPRLYPMAVHPEFRDKVLRALQIRGTQEGGVNWEWWDNVLQAAMK